MSIIPTESIASQDATTQTHKDAWNFVLSLMGNDADRAADLIKQVYHFFTDTSHKKIGLIFLGPVNNCGPLFIELILPIIDNKLFLDYSYGGVVIAIDPNDVDYVKERIYKVRPTKWLIALNTLPDYVKDLSKYYDIKIIKFDTPFVGTFDLNDGAVEALHSMIIECNKQ